jgi:hypothetical protein
MGRKPHIDAETRVQIELDEATLIFNSVFFMGRSSPHEENLRLLGSESLEVVECP